MKLTFNDLETVKIIKNELETVKINKNDLETIKIADNNSEIIAVINNNLEATRKNILIEKDKITLNETGLMTVIDLNISVST